MKIRYFNAKIMTMADDACVIVNGELHTQDDKIIYIGDSTECEEFDCEINVNGNETSHKAPNGMKLSTIGKLQRIKLWCSMIIEKKYPERTNEKSE